MLEFLPTEIRNAVKHINGGLLYEMRLRSGCPVKINYGGNWRYLGAYGVVSMRERALKPSRRDIESLVFAAGNYSLYSCAEEMKECYITDRDGVRIGLAGTVVLENGKVVSLRDITSVCVRVPHRVEGCADEVFSLFDEGIINLLLLSPPGYGKTTILRALTEKIVGEYPDLNVLVADERGELFSDEKRCEADVIRFLPKSQAIDLGIRSLRPDLIVTDEVQNDEWEGLKKVRDCGIKIVASCHSGEDISRIPTGIFDRYVVLGKREGKILSVYDETKNRR